MKVASVSVRQKSLARALPGGLLDPGHTDGEVLITSTPAGALQASNSATLSVGRQEAEMLPLLLSRGGGGLT